MNPWNPILVNEPAAIGSMMETLSRTFQQSRAARTGLELIKEMASEETQSDMVQCIERLEFIENALLATIDESTRTQAEMMTARQAEPALGDGPRRV